MLMGLISSLLYVPNYHILLLKLLCIFSKLLRQYYSIFIFIMVCASVGVHMCVTKMRHFVHYQNFKYIIKFVVTEKSI